MSSTEADVSIILKADDQASSTIDSATKQINDSYRTLTNNARTAGREWINNNSTLYELGRTMTSLHRVTSTAISTWSNYNLIQIRNEQITQRVTDAQEKLAQALASGDPSRIAAAQKEVQIALEDQKKAALEADIQYATMTANMISASGSIITTVIPRIKGLITTLNDLRTASAVGAAVDVAAGGGVGAGALAGSSGLGRVLSKGAGVAGKVAGPAAIGISLLSMMGEQQAGETSVPTGIDALSQVGGDISKVVSNTFNIIVQDAGAAAKTVQRELSNILTFGGQPAS